jgi:hypothetical protein
VAAGADGGGGGGTSVMTGCVGSLLYMSPETIGDDKV